MKRISLLFPLILGGGTTQVNVVADPNSTLQSRSTTLNFSAGGGYPER